MANEVYCFLATHTLRGYDFGKYNGPPQGKVITEEELAKYRRGDLKKGQKFEAMPATRVNGATKVATSTNDLTIPSDCQKKRNFRSGCMSIACCVTSTHKHFFALYNTTYWYWAEVAVSTEKKYVSYYSISTVHGKPPKTTTTTSTNEEAKADDTAATDAPQTTEESTSGILEASQGYTPNVDDIVLAETDWKTETSGTEFFSIRSILGVFGLPYQFLPHADPRISQSQDTYKQDINRGYGYGDTVGIGAEYAKHIVSAMPILFMAPGKPSFMGTYSDEEKKSILAKMAGAVSNAVGIEDLLEGDGRYYTFEYATAEYYKYVNPMCRIASAYLNVANKYLDGCRLDSVNWMTYTKGKLSGLFNSMGGVQDWMSIPFYIESETQISDSFGNSTSDSTLASTVNSLSDTAREAQFILGNVGAGTGIDAISADADIQTNQENINKMLGNIMGGNKFLSNLKNHLASVASGGKMIFPKIWSGSDFSRSYNITIKLRSPDMDNLSLYFNIIVPTLHLVGFVAPHMMSNDPNSYANPFLIRAIYKGFFNVDLGIITNMDISKGDQAQFNANGVPTTVDISFTITDLYEVMSITPTDATTFKYDTLNNTAQMDYIANFCGVNVYKPEIGRTLSMWFVNNFTNRAKDFVSINFWGNMKTSLANRIANVFLYGRS